MESQFKNSEGRTVKTILSDDIISQISDLTELYLIEMGVFYIRNGNVFNVQSDCVNLLLEAQLMANKKMMADGVLTLDMLKADFESNFINRN